MIELFRKYSGIAFIVLIILFIGLIFMMDGVSQGGVGSGPKVAEINGRVYTQSEVDRKGTSYQRLLQDVVQSRYSTGNFTAYEDIAPYAQAMQAGDPVDYLTKRLILQKAAKEYGIAPSKEQIEDYLKNTLFASKEGEFDQKGYSEFITKRVQRLGLGVIDLNDLVGEVITLKKLTNIIGGGLKLDEKLTEKEHMLVSQKLTYEQFTFPLSKIKETISPTEEEVKEYWEANKGSYLSEPQKKITYLVSDANIVVKEAEYRAEQKELARKEGKTDEEIEEMKFEFPSEQRSALIGQAGDAIDNFFIKLQDQEGVGFEELAKNAEIEVKTSEMFKASEAPFELKFPIYQGRGTVNDFVFNTPANTGSMESVSDVLPIGEGRFLLFRVDDELLPESLPFEEAKARAKIDLIDERAEKSLEQEMSKMRDSLVEKAKNAESIEALSEELNLTYTKRENSAVRDTIPSEPSASEFFIKASETEDGSFSDPILQPEVGQERAIIVRPLSREYLNSEENKAALENYLDRSSKLLENILFENWIAQKVAQSGVVKFDAP